MKKIIAYIGAWTLFGIGDLTSKIEYIKLGDGYFFDKKLKTVGYWLANLYQWTMINSSNIQEWGKLKTPWKNVKQNEQNENNFDEI